MMNKDQILIYKDRLDDFYKNLKIIYDSYSAFPALIDKEHSYVVARDLENLESVVVQKEELTRKISEALEGNRRIGESFSDDYPDQKLDSVSELLDLVSSLEEVSENQPLKEVLEKLKNLHDRLQVLIRDVSFQMEQNKYLITKLMEEKRNNFLFWQEVISDTLASYNRKGVQKGTGPVSIFKISA